MVLRTDPFTGYDQYLRRTNLTVLQGSAPILQHTNAFDLAGRLLVVGDTAGHSATYSYLADSALVGQIRFQQGSTLRMTTAKQYDPLNRLTALSSTVGQAPSFAAFAYVYNRANQRVRRSEADGSYWRYGYDSLGQVTSGKKYWPDQTPVAGQQFEYAFDDIGNRVSAKAGGDDRGAGLRSASYSANLLNQYSSRTVPGAVDVMGMALATNSVTVNGQSVYRKGEYFRKELSVNNASSPVWQQVDVAAPNETTVTRHEFVAKTPETFTHDADGNLTQDGRWLYTWDGENRLVGMSSANTNPAVGPQQWVEFQYDWQGRRISKKVGAAGSGVATNDLRFVYDGWNLAAILNSDFSLLTSFVCGLDLSGTMEGAGGVGGLLWMTVPSGANAGTYFCAYDGNGNMMALVSAADGSVAARYEYGPFGELIRATGPVAKANPIRWSTKYQDDETDLVMYLRRPYSASSGRWLSRDPIEESGGINLYAFLGNAPLSKVDPFGEDAAVVSAGGYTGHTSFVIINPDGSGTAFHFYAAHHGGGCCGSSGSLLALCCDTVNIWPEPFDNLQGYLQAQQGLHGATRVTAYALGSSVDDQVATTLLNDAAKEDQGIYSLALGIECHSKSWDWFQDYVGGGPQINPIQPQPLPPFWPERWFETPRHRQENPPFPSIPNPTR